MLYDLMLIAAGLAVLVLAGDALVKGAVNLALRLGIPALVVGLTIVAFGTSAPEMLVSVQAVLKDAPALALGNVVGSNIANILLVMGLPALFAAVAVGRDVLRDYVIMLLVTGVFIAVAFGGTFGRVQALILLAGLVLVLAELFWRTRRQQIDPDDLEGVEAGLPGWRIALLVGAGLVGLPIGADLLVDGAVGVATALGVSEAVIGLTVVAVGTSLPELATTMAAALRREGGVALGNVLGSNVFNLLAIIGVAGLVGPIPVPPEMLQKDLWVMLGASVLLAGWVLTGRPIRRLAGAGFLLLYATYVATLF
jgi:cation:H+ antiporter